MLKTLAALLFVTSLGNAAPAPNSNLDATPAPVTTSPVPAQIVQPGPPQDAQFQHGVVDPRGTDAQPLAVRVVSMPAGLAHAEEGAPPGEDNAGLMWIAIVIGAIQSLLLAAAIYFVMQATNGTRRLADALERVLAKNP
ncbi:MAG TPA: hypothetical protein VGF56_15970 [Rhizomicrobium sp.]|jgi:hypothetical protein